MAITIKELHRTTGKYVRLAGSSRTPLVVTNHGKEVAVIANPSLLKGRHRKRTILPEYETLMAKTPGNNLLDDLNAIRGER